MKRAIFSLTVLLSLPVSLLAQQPDCRHRTIPVNVTDRDGSVIAGLAADDFRASYHSANVKILSANLNIAPRRIVVLLDLSASMNGGGGSNKPFVAFLAARDALLSTRAFNEVALLTFGERVRSRSPLTRNRQQAAQWMTELEQGDQRKMFGHTAMLDAISEALELLSPAQVGDAIYLVTDGVENASRAHGDELKERLLASGVRLFAFVLNQNDSSSMHVDGRGYRMDISDFVRDSGGTSLILQPEAPYRWPPRFNISDEGQRAIRLLEGLLFESIEKVYFVEIELPENVDKPRTWKLELAPNRLATAHATIRYPTRLYSCSAASDSPRSSPR